MHPTFSPTEKRLIVLCIGILCLLLALETFSWGSRGFFYDEAWVANSVKAPTLEKMFFYEKVAQNTPAGVLLLMRTLVALIGDYAWVYRVPALLATLLCIPLLIALGKQLQLAPRIITYATLFFTLHPLVLQYSQEAKQYPFDMLIILGVFFLYVRSSQAPSTRNTTEFIVGTILSFFFSYVTPFALGGIAFYEFLRWMRTKKFPKLVAVQLCVSTFAIGIIYLVLYLPNHTPLLHYLWVLNRGFPTFATWYEPFVFIVMSFYHLAGAFSTTFLAPFFILLIGTGAYALRKNKRYNAYLLGIVLTMIVLALIGSYPLSQSAIHIRVQLFLLPLLSIYIGAALTFLESKTQHTKVFFACIVLGMLATAAYALTIPTYGRTNDMSYVFKDYKAHYAGGETLISLALQPEFEYYVGDPRTTPQVTLVVSRTVKNYTSWVHAYIANHTNHSFWFLPSPASAEPRIAQTIFKQNCTILYEYHHLKSELYQVRC